MSEIVPEDRCIHVHNFVSSLHHRRIHGSILPAIIAYPARELSADMTWIGLLPFPGVNVCINMYSSFRGLYSGEVHGHATHGMVSTLSKSQSTDSLHVGPNHLRHGF